MAAFQYFFSYSRRNIEFVIKLAADLEKAGINAWLDQKNIAPGSRWDDSIQTALQNAKCLLVILSGASVQSQNVMDEISYAISLGKQVVPLMIENCEVPFRLARLQYIDFTGDYDRAFEQLLLVLHEKDPEVVHPKKENSSAGRENKKRIAEPVTPLKTSSQLQLPVKHFYTNKAFLLLLAVVLIAVLAIVKWSNSNSSTPPVSTTVFVHGKGGKQDMILRQKGFVTMDLGAERKRASINENGQAFFQNLHVGDSVRLEIDFSEPYKTIYPNSVYVIQPNSNIYLPVALQGIDKVKGMVLYNDKPLEGVIVKLIGKNRNLLDTTNQTGDYSFTIPEELQANEYQVWFIKKMFKTVSAPAFPQTGKPLDMVMKKE